MAVLYAIYTPSLPFEVRCESGVLTDIHPENDERNKDVYCPTNFLIPSNLVY